MFVTKSVLEEVCPDVCELNTEIVVVTCQHSNSVLSINTQDILATFCWCWKIYTERLIVTYFPKLRALLACKESLLVMLPYKSRKWHYLPSTPSAKSSSLLGFLCRGPKGNIQHCENQKILQQCASTASGPKIYRQSQEEVIYKHPLWLPASPKTCKGNWWFNWPLMGGRLGVYSKKVFDGHLDI